MEFSFSVRLVYSAAQAFNDISDARAHDRLTKRIFDILAEEFPRKDSVTVEVEPV